ncbi:MULTISPECIES: ComF family protein [Clostridium]|uniref:ComF family protein n=1 Tax=Clostridium cibarium TaxID=2762247 RepID=A0ABR8PXT8_9CLOT|nr:MULTISPECIES: ComF family protein [Clostridium]MBD7912952.1 ComF family protein [Clostridium cibarium]
MEKKFYGFLKDIYLGVLELIYPKEDKCIICRKEEVNGICNNCRNDIMPCFDKELCVGYYKGVLKELILKFKYKKDFTAGEILVKLAEEKILSFERDYYITFIPISKERLKKYGFNQCEYLAQEIGWRNGFKIIDTLKKIKDTRVQKTLNKEERTENMAGAFAVKDISKVKGRKFILIDDVITTGSTINEGIRVLKESGAIEIKTLTLAKSHI